TINYKQDFTDYKEAFKKWEFSALDFEKLAVTPEDFVYADPPYDVQFTHYSREDFSWPDQERLAKWLSGLDCPVIVSNQYTERIFDLYQSYGFDMITKDAPRYISSDGNRSMAREIVGTLRVKRGAQGRVAP
ncbi:adenine-specific DNA methylase, partial [mine drainage metagenome]